MDTAPSMTHSRFEREADVAPSIVIAKVNGEAIYQWFVLVGR
jgi:hypothetical protein